MNKGGEKNDEFHTRSWSTLKNAIWQGLFKRLAKAIKASASSRFRINTAAMNDIPCTWNQHRFVDVNDYEHIQQQPSIISDSHADILITARRTLLIHYWVAYSNIKMLSSYAKCVMNVKLGICTCKGKYAFLDSSQHLNLQTTDYGETLPSHATVQLKNQFLVLFICSRLCSFMLWN